MGSSILVADHACAAEMLHKNQSQDVSSPICTNPRQSLMLRGDENSFYDSTAYASSASGLKRQTQPQGHPTQVGHLNTANLQQLQITAEVGNTIEDFLQQGQQQKDAQRGAQSKGLAHVRDKLKQLRAQQQNPHLVSQVEKNTARPLTQNVGRPWPSKSTETGNHKRQRETTSLLGPKPPRRGKEEICCIRTRNSKVSITRGGRGHPYSEGSCTSRWKQRWPRFDETADTASSSKIFWTSERRQGSGHSRKRSTLSGCSRKSISPTSLTSPSSASFADAAETTHYRGAGSKDHGKAQWNQKQANFQIKRHWARLERANGC